MGLSDESIIEYKSYSSITRGNRKSKKEYKKKVGGRENWAPCRDSWDKDNEEIYKNNGGTKNVRKKKQPLEKRRDNSKAKRTKTNRQKKAGNVVKKGN